MASKPAPHGGYGRPATRSACERLAAVCAFAVVGLATTACGTMADNARAADYCRHYAQLVKQAQDFRQHRVDTSSPEEMRAEVQRFLDQLSALVAESDGRLSTGYSQLQVALDDFKQSVLATSSETRSQTRKLLADSFDEVQKNWAQFQATVQAQCT